MCQTVLTHLAGFLQGRGSASQHSCFMVGVEAAGCGTGMTDGIWTVFCVGLPGWGERLFGVSAFTYRSQNARLLNLPRVWW